MSKRWMTYTINNQLLDNLDHHVYLLELAVLITNIEYTLQSYWYCSKWDIPHSTMKYNERKLSLSTLYTNKQNQQHCNVAYYIWYVTDHPYLLLTTKLT